MSAAGFLLLLLLRMCSASRVCCCSCSSSSSCSSPSSTSQEAGCDCKEPAASELLVLLLLQRCCCCCCCTSQQLRATAVEWQQIFAASARESIDRGLQAPQYPDTRFPAPVYQTYSSSDSSTSPLPTPILGSLSSPFPLRLLLCSRERLQAVHHPIAYKNRNGDLSTEDPGATAAKSK